MWARGSCWRTLVPLSFLFCLPLSSTSLLLSLPPLFLSSTALSLSCPSLVSSHPFLPPPHPLVSSSLPSLSVWHALLGRPDHLFQHQHAQIDPKRFLFPRSCLFINITMIPRPPFPVFLSFYTCWNSVHGMCLSLGICIVLKYCGGCVGLYNFTYDNILELVFLGF